MKNMQNGSILSKTFEPSGQVAKNVKKKKLRDHMESFVIFVGSCHKHRFFFCQVLLGSFQNISRDLDRHFWNKSVRKNFKLFSNQS